VTFEWAVRGVALALGVAVAAILTRYLGPERFGDLSLGFLLVTIAQSAADFGFKQIAVREASVRPDERDRIAGTYVMLRGSVGVALFAIVAAVGLLLARDGTTRLTVVIVASTLLLGFFSSAGFMLHVRLRNELFASTILLQSIVWLGVVAAASLLGLSLPALALGFLGMTGLHVAVTFVLARRLVPFEYHLDRRWLRRLLKLSAPLAVAGVFAALLSKVDAVIVYSLAGAEAGGMYAASYRIYEQLQIVPAAVITLIAPLLASWQAVDRARLRRSFERIGRYLMVAGLAAGVGVALVAEPLAVLLFGEQFRDAGPLLAVMSVAFVFQAVSYLAGATLVAVGRTRAFAAILAVALAADMGLVFALVPHYGALAAAWVLLGTRAFNAVVMYAYLNRHFQLRLSVGFTWRLLPPLAVLAAVALALRDTSSVLALAIAVLGYATACLLTGALRPSDLRSLLAREEVARI